jgi:hypothetical protein
MPSTSGDPRWCNKHRQDANDFHIPHCEAGFCRKCIEELKSEARAAGKREGIEAAAKECERVCEISVRQGSVDAARGFASVGSAIRALLQTEARAEKERWQPGDLCVCEQEWDPVFDRCRDSYCIRSKRVRPTEARAETGKGKRK